MDTITLCEYDRKEIVAQIDDLLKFADEQIHPIVSPDNWWIYSNLHDDLEQLKITVNHKFEIGKQLQAVKWE